MHAFKLNGLRLSFRFLLIFGLVEDQVMGLLGPEEEDANWEEHWEEQDPKQDYFGQEELAAEFLGLGASFAGF